MHSRTLLNFVTMALLIATIHKCSFATEYLHHPDPNNTLEELFNLAVGSARFLDDTELTIEGQNVQVSFLVDISNLNHTLHIRGVNGTSINIVPIYGYGFSIHSNNNDPNNEVKFSDLSLNCIDNGNSAAIARIDSSVVVFNGVTIQGSIFKRDGLAVSRSSVDFLNCAVSGNQTSNEYSLISATHSVVVVDNCTFDSNTSDFRGSCLMAAHSNLSFSNSYFHKNSVALRTPDINSEAGGGVAFFSECEVELENSVFRSNEVYNHPNRWDRAGFGGAICLKDAVTMSISSCIF